MIDHLGITVADFDASKAFYDKAMAPLGASLLYMVPLEYTGGAKVGGYGRDRPVFWLSTGKDNGGPGLRPHYHPDYYAAFVFDPDGNNVEAVCHAPE